MIEEVSVSSEILAKYDILNETLFQAVKEDPADVISVEIGDSKQPDFKPQVKIMRWDNEVNFSMRAEEHPDATVEFEGDVIKYITPDYEVHQYDKPDASDEGGFEFEWILKTIPSSNVLSATIQTKGLTFHKQLPLTNEQIADGDFRPEDVINSYVIYHDSKAGNFVGGKEYRAGKFGEIKRPKATDANGDWTWCDPDIDEVAGKIYVTVPPKWLANAALPVVVDPTFGYTTLGASESVRTTGVSSNRAHLKASLLYTASAGDTVTMLSAYGRGAVSNGGKCDVSFYTFSGGVPVTRQVAAQTLTWNIETATKDSAALSVALSAGVTYVVAIGNYVSTPTSGPEWYLKYDTLTLGDADTAAAGALTATWTQTATAAEVPSIWATYTTGTIAHDADSNSGYQAASSGYTWSHTCTGSNRYLTVGVAMLSLAQTVTSITYNSVAMTFLGAQNSVTGAARTELWGLVAPSTGANTISVTLSGSIASAGVASSYTNVHQTSPTESFNSAQATNVGAADATVDVTTVANNDWAVDMVATDDTAITVGAGQTVAGNVTGAGGSGAMSYEGPKTPAGAITMSWTNVGALATWSIGAIALRPVSAAALLANPFNGTNFFQLLGVGT